jgi:hypothetical protein
MFIKRDHLINWLILHQFVQELGDMEFLDFVRVSDSAQFTFPNDFTNCVSEKIVVLNFQRCHLAYNEFLNAFEDDLWCNDY